MAEPGDVLRIPRLGVSVGFRRKSREEVEFEVVGRPRDRDWKVLFLRRGMDPFVIDASMVDPEHFMKVLRQHRPK